MTDPNEPRMPFGKFRNKPVSDVLRRDPSYLAWFCDTVDGNEGVKQAIRALPGFSEASRRYSLRKNVGMPQVRPPVEEAELPNMGVDPRLSREDLDRLCKEVFDLVTEKRAVG